MSMELAFNGIQFEIISRDGHPWVTARQLAQALGYAREDSVLKIYERNKDEFSSMMSATVKMTVGITEVMVRIFSMRGCWLVSMLSRTPVAKQFRRWVLDVLDKLAEEERARLAEDVTPSDSRPSRRTDPERKALTAIINTWVGMAPVHYASARAQVNAHFGVASVDALTVAQVKEAIKYVQDRIDALPPAPALPANQDKVPSPMKADRKEAMERIKRLSEQARIGFGIVRNIVAINCSSCGISSCAPQAEHDVLDVLDGLQATASSSLAAAYNALESAYRLGRCYGRG